MSRLEEIIKTVTANVMREITVERAKQIAIEYAKECSQASLEKASEKGKIKSFFLSDKNGWIEITNGNFQFNPNNYAQKYEVNKSSITDKENIVIL